MMGAMLSLLSLRQETLPMARTVAVRLTSVSMASSPKEVPTYISDATMSGPMLTCHAQPRRQI